VLTGTDFLANACNKHDLCIASWDCSDEAMHAAKSVVFCLLYPN